MIITIKNKRRIKTQGGGQECPPYTVRSIEWIGAQFGRPCSDPELHLPVQRLQFLQRGPGELEGIAHGVFPLYSLRSLLIFSHGTVNTAQNNIAANTLPPLAFTPSGLCTTISLRVQRPLMPQLTYLEAIRQGIWEEMERDPAVFCIGEDIGIYGGAFKVTDGFIDHFGPERVIDTPIAESAIVGAAFGASLTGLRPVAEFQFMDFIGCAFNQIVNMVAKSHYRWNAPAPLVIRGPSGGNVHGGPFHSQNPEMWFVHSPGLKVVCPATAYDAKGLIKAAIRDNSPVIFFEHKYLYRRIKDEVPAEDYIVPIGKARIARAGRDLSVITYAAMVYTALEAAALLAQEGIELEVVDLRTVSPLDREAIAATVQKTSKVIILHEHARTGGLAGEISAIINEEAFDALDGPIVRITAPDTPVPFSPPQEEFYLPKVSDVVREARKLHAY